MDFIPTFAEKLSVMTKYFRPHRRMYVDSMNEKMAVTGIMDIRRHIESKDFTMIPGYFKNIRILARTKRMHRDPGDEWGPETYMVVADFDGYTEQCIGFANFCE